MAEAPPLIGGPYKPPRYRIGGCLYDIIRGDLTVLTVSDSPVVWPLGTTHPGCRPTPIITTELVRAIRVESEIAIMHHWGISRWTVCRWRRALRVPRFNAGTMQLWRAAAAVKLGPEMRKKAHEIQRANLKRKRAAAAER